MPLASMTGFARVDGSAPNFRFTWEARSVNAKGLDVRLRLAPGFDSLEPALRADAAASLARGSLSATLTVQQAEPTLSVRLNEQFLQQMLSVSAGLADRFGIDPPRLDGLLALRGVLEVTEDRAGPTAGVGVGADEVRAGFVAALAQLVAARRMEGEALGGILEQRLSSIAALTRRAEACPARLPGAIRARLDLQLEALLEGERKLDPDRLHQEAVLLALRADIREELDRLVAHVAQARDLLEAGGPVGRRLDFLSQELAREANTLCAKSNDLALTAIGLDLKAAVEQFREQVQNLE